LVAESVLDHDISLTERIEPAESDCFTTQPTVGVRQHLAFLPHKRLNDG